MRIQGYAARHGVTIRTPQVAAFTVRAGFAMLAGFTTRVCVDHDESRAFAATRNETLRLWQDPAGLAFEAEISDEWLEDEIRSARRAAVSCTFEGIHVEDGTHDGEPVKVFVRARIPEISLVAVGRCPGAHVWPADAPPEELTERQIAARRAFNFHQDHHRFGFLHSHPRDGATARGRAAISSPLLPASVTALMDDPEWRLMAAHSREAARRCFAVTR